MVAFHGQMGMFTRAMAYILSHGADGLRQVSGDAVLNANYVLRQLVEIGGRTGTADHQQRHGESEGGVGEIVQPLGHSAACASPASL